MKKITSILALSMALVMVLGMTAFAEGDSITANTTSRTEGVTVGARPDESTVQSVESKVESSLTEISAPANAKTGATGTVLFTIWFEGSLEQGTDLVFELPGAFDFTKYVYWAVHTMDNGSLENLSVEETAEGYIKVKSPSGLSPFTFVGYDRQPTLTGEGDTPNNSTPNNSTPNNSAPNNSATTNDTTTTSTTPTTPLSPQTGETLPVAAVIAVLAFACAAVVGAKKVIAER